MLTLYRLKKTNERGDENGKQNAYYNRNLQCKNYVFCYAKIHH